MEKLSQWTADVVLANLLEPDQIDWLLMAAERESRDGLRGEFAALFNTPPEWGRVTFKYDRRKGRRHISIAGLKLAPGVLYSSAHDRSYSASGWGSDETGFKVVEFQAMIRVEGQTPPETVLQSLVGRHASAVIDHPALRDPGVMITWAGLNGSPRAWTSFSALLETVDVKIS